MYFEKKVPLKRTNGVSEGEGSYGWCCRTLHVSNNGSKAVISEIMDCERPLLGKCLKSTVSEDPSTSNMLNGPKHYWSVFDSSFIIFIDQLEGNLARKISVSDM